MRALAHLFIVFVLLGCMTAAAAAPSAPPPQYVCPMSVHPEVFEHPGRCPICGMELVAKESGAAKTRVAILVFDGVQLIDFTAPYEVFSHTDFDVFSVGAGGPAIVGGGLAITPLYTFASSPQADVVIVPGGRVESGNREMIAWIRRQTEGAKIVMSICNGSFLLAEAGLLDGLSATTTYGNLSGLARAYPKTKVVRNQRFVDNGKIITTGGLSAGMDGSLHVVERLLGPDQAKRVALGLEYHWQPESLWTRPSLADRFVPNVNTDGLPPLTRVSSNGDTASWRVEVTTSAAPTPELLGRLAAKVEEATGWKAESAERRGSERRYRFEDEERRPWSASLTLQAAEAGPGARFIFTLKRVD